MANKKLRGFRKMIGKCEDSWKLFIVDESKEILNAVLLFRYIIHTVIVGQFLNNVNLGDS